MVTINQKPARDIQITKRKEPKQNTKNKQKQTANHKGRGQEKKKGAEDIYKNSLNSGRQTSPTSYSVTSRAPILEQKPVNFSFWRLHTGALTQPELIIPTPRKFI